MKKFFIFLLCIFLFGCGSRSLSIPNSKDHEIYHTKRSYVEIVTIKGHEYIIVTTNAYDGGVNIIHSESCHCKNGY